MKRSAQVVVVMMAATGVGATSYVLMPRQDCAPAQPGMMQPDACRSSSTGSSHGSSAYSSSRSSGTAPSSTSHAATPAALVGGTQRGGFGGFASHFSGGS